MNTTPVRPFQPRARRKAIPRTQPARSSFTQPFPAASGVESTPSIATRGSVSLLCRGCRMFDGINSVSASDLTGSVIVLYAATLDIRRVEKCIERAVAVAVGPERRGQSPNRDVHGQRTKEFRASSAVTLLEAAEAAAIDVTTAQRQRPFDGCSIARKDGTWASANCRQRGPDAALGRRSATVGFYTIPREFCDDRRRLYGGREFES